MPRKPKGKPALEALIKNASEECITWDNSVCKQIRHDGKMHNPARLSLVLSKPSEKPKKYAIQTCENSNCVNPHHLEWSELRLTVAWRESGNCTLTRDQVRYVRSSNKSRSELADELGVNVGSITSVRTGKTWAWLDDYGTPGKITSASFLEDAVASKTDDCIIWPYTLYEGRGFLKYKGKKCVAARKSLELSGGGIGGRLGQTCGQKSCVNPRHLFWND